MGPYSCPRCGYGTRKDDISKKGDFKSSQLIYTCGSILYIWWANGSYHHEMRGQCKGLKQSAE